MNASVNETGEKSLASLAEQVGEAFNAGVPLGDLFGYDEQDYGAVYALGHSFYSQARYLDALKAFSFLVMNQPYERRYVNAYASCLQMLKQYENAIAYYALATVMDMDDPGPVFHTAECLIAQGRLDEAADALGMVIQGSETPAHSALKSRAEALLKLLKIPQPS